MCRLLNTAENTLNASHVPCPLCEATVLGLGWEPCVCDWNTAKVKAAFWLLSLCCRFSHLMLIGMLAACQHSNTSWCATECQPEFVKHWWHVWDDCSGQRFTSSNSKPDSQPDPQQSPKRDPKSDPYPYTTSLSEQHLCLCF